jgi:hypothetical protein
VLQAEYQNNKLQLEQMIGELRKLEDKVKERDVEIKSYEELTGRKSKTRGQSITNVLMKSVFVTSAKKDPVESSRYSSSRVMDDRHLHCARANCPGSANSTFTSCSEALTLLSRRESVRL